MVSEGRLTPNNVASKSDYDAMPRKPHVPLGTLKKTLPLLPTLLYSLSLSLLSALAIAALLADVSTLDVGRRLVDSPTLGLPLENVSSRDPNHRSIQMDE